MVCGNRENSPENASDPSLWVQPGTGSLFPDGSGVTASMTTAFGSPLAATIASYCCLAYDFP